MPEQAIQQVQEYNDQIKVGRILQVKALQIEKGLTIGEACDEIGLATSTFYDWLGNDVFSKYLAETRHQLQSLAASSAIEALPTVMEYMIGLATGQDSARGASPIAAAKFVVEMANRFSGTEIPQDRKIPTTYQPQQVAVVIQGGAPVVDEGGHIIIDVTPNKD